MAFRECELQIQNQEVMARKALAEVEALELTNLERKRHWVCFKCIFH
jgi:hypothetical protein